MWGVSLTSKIGQSRSYLWGVSFVTPYSAWILIKYYKWQHLVVGHCMGVKLHMVWCWWPICEGNPPVTGTSPSKRPVTRSFQLDVSLICAWTNGWANTRDAGDLRRHRVHCGVTLWYVYVDRQLRGYYHFIIHWQVTCAFFHRCGRSWRLVAN